MILGWSLLFLMAISGLAVEAICVVRDPMEASNEEVAEAVILPSLGVLVFVMMGDRKYEPILGGGVALIVLVIVIRAGMRFLLLARRLPLTKYTRHRERLNMTGYAITMPLLLVSMFAA